MKKMLAVFIAGAMLLGACKTNTTDTDKTPEAKTENNETVATAPEGKYKPEKGIVNYIYGMAGMAGTQTLKFRNHGAEEMMVVELDMMGKKITTHALKKDGYMYSWSDATPGGMKTKITADQNINYRDIPDSLRHRFKIEEGGTETFLGKEAKSFTMNDATSGMKGTTLVWEGIPLKSVVEVQGQKIEFTATRLDENPALTDKDFEIPAGVQFKEM